MDPGEPVKGDGQPFQDQEGRAELGELGAHGLPRVDDTIAMNRPYAGVFAHGDVESALRAADRLVEARFHQGRQTHAPLEPRGCLASWLPGDETLTFWHSTQVKYFPERKLLRMEDRRFRWDEFLTGMHARGGFEDRRPLNLSWSIIVDLVCIGFILWIASGIYMWWKLPQTRTWGWLALGAGVAVFALFLVGL